MRLRSATAIALALGLAAFSSNAMAETKGAEKGAETPAVGQLPGNEGGEGAAGNFARDQNLIDKRDHRDDGSAAASDSSQTEGQAKLPGNVSGEGNAEQTVAPGDPAYQTGAGEPSGIPVEKKLPGNVGGEGSGKTK